MSTPTKLKRGLALALAGGSLAIGVPAALAASGGGDDAASMAPADAPAFIQDAQNGEGQARPNGEDCPERDGSGSGGSGDGEQGSATPEPSL